MSNVNSTLPPDLTGTSAIVTGASRGFGRGISTALAYAGAHVIGIARTPAPLLEVQEELGGRLTAVVGDATDADLANDLVARHRPRTLVLNAGAVPHMAPLQEQSWETFSSAWQIDTRAAFQWTKAALLLPLDPGSVVIAVSSGAALQGSPLSGGYAGAKAAMRFVATYAAGESERAGLGIRFHTLLPQLTPAAAVGSTGAAGYAEREGIDLRAYLKRYEPFVTTDLVGATVADLARASEGLTNIELLLTGSGARALPKP